MKFALCFLFTCLLWPCLAAQSVASGNDAGGNVDKNDSLNERSPASFKIWPEKAPGVVDELVEREVTEGGTRMIAGEPIYLTTDISAPELVFYKADREGSRPVVVICPGGGHHLLAYDLEGVELALWLNRLGIHAAILKYRVPSTNKDFRGLPALQDAQRALRLVRAKAEELSIDPTRIGVMGFSAGGETAARASLQFHQNHYEPIDEVDAISSKPNFAMLIYPAYLVSDSKLKEELDPRNHPQPEELPEFFFVHTWDDNVSPLNRLVLAEAWKESHGRCELHLYDRGGHGYGIRPVDALPVTRWTSPAEAWLELQLVAQPQAN